MMSSQEKESVREEGLIDIVEIAQKCFVILRRMWLWVLILVIVSAGLMGVHAKATYVARYTAYTVLTVSREWELSSDEVASYYDNVTADQLASVFPHILTSDLLRRKVAKDMGNAGVSGVISASATENTNIVTVSVTDADPQRAYDTLQSVIKNYPAISEVILGKTKTMILDDSGVPTAPVNAFDLKNSVVKGGILGLLLGIAWVGLLALTRRTICKEADIKKRMNVQCLGSIPAIAKKARAKKNHEENFVITNPKIETILQEPLRIIRNKVEYSAHEAQKKTFLVTSALAGEGKSTFAVNLALSLAMNGRKVALIDCDLRHPSDRKILGVEEGKGLSEILKREAKMADCIIRSTQLGMDEKTQFLFVPGGEPIEEGSELLSSPFLKSIIKKMEDWADYVILDSAPVGLLTDAVVLAENIDGAIYVVRKDYSSVNEIMDGMEFLADNGVEIIGGVLNEA